MTEAGRVIQFQAINPIQIIFISFNNYTT